MCLCLKPRMNSDSLCVCVCVCVFVCVFVGLFVSLFPVWFVCVFVFLLVRLFFGLFVCLFVCLFLYSVEQKSNCDTAKNTEVISLLYKSSQPNLVED